MHIGIISRYFKVSKYGFIKTFNESIFFHSSNLETHIERLTVVFFEIENTDRGEVAINIRDVDSDINIIEKLYHDKDFHLHKWLAIYSNLKLSNKHHADFVKDGEKKVVQFLESEEVFLNDYVNQFSSKEFWDNFEVVLDTKFRKDSNDWDNAWWFNFIESKYPKTILGKPYQGVFNKYDFQIYNQLNYEWNSNNIEFTDEYIHGFIHYHESLGTEAFVRGGRGESKIEVKKSYLNKRKKDIISNFKDKYSREEHFETLKKYLHNHKEVKKWVDNDFIDLLENKFNEFYLNNCDDNSLIFPTEREINEDSFIFE